MEEGGYYEESKNVAKYYNAALKQESCNALAYCNLDISCYNLALETDDPETKNAYFADAIKAIEQAVSHPPYDLPMLTTLRNAYKHHKNTSFTIFHGNDVVVRECSTNEVIENNTALSMESFGNDFCVTATGPFIISVMKKK